VIRLTYTNSKIEQDKEEFNRKTLYDDEIADHHFSSIIKKLRKLKIEFVFVFDELDKVDDNEVDSLIKEMKPHLVSGLATYIVVAGQSLFYKYHFAKSADDAVLASLFSRIIHVPLLKPSDFTSQFKSIAQLKDTEKVEEIKPYIDYLIFESKRVPRRFINLIRQKIVWDGDRAIIEYENEITKFQNTYSKILQIIDGMYNEEVY
jgi:hypothetical protein